MQNRNNESDDESLVPDLLDDDDEEFSIESIHPVKKLKSAIHTAIADDKVLSEQKQAQIRRNLDRFQKIAFFVQENVTIFPGVKQLHPQLAMAEKYWLEKLDHRHRSPNYLIKWHQHWQQSSTSENFFDYLDNQELNYPEILQDSDRSLVLYSQDPLLFETKYKNGKIYDKYDLEVSTIHYHDDEYPGFAGYIIDRNNRLMLSEYQDGTLHHSSFTAGDKILCAGMIKVANGKIIKINNRSGHYFHPAKYNLEYFYCGIKSIPESVFAENAVINFGGNIEDSQGILRVVDFIYSLEAFFQFAQEQIKRTKNDSYFFMRDPRERNIANDVLILLKHVKQAYNGRSKNKELNSIELRDLKAKITDTLDKLKKVNSPSLQLKSIISWCEEAQCEIFNKIQTKKLRK